MNQQPRFLGCRSQRPKQQQRSREIEWGGGGVERDRSRETDRERSRETNMARLDRLPTFFFFFLCVCVCVSVHCARACVCVRQALDTSWQSWNVLVLWVQQSLFRSKRCTHIGSFSNAYQAHTHTHTHTHKRTRCSPDTNCGASVR